MTTENAQNSTFESDPSRIMSDPSKIMLNPSKIELTFKWIEEKHEKGSSAENNEGINEAGAAVLISGLAQITAMHRCLKYTCRLDIENYKHYQKPYDVFNQITFIKILEKIKINKTLRVTFDKTNNLISIIIPITDMYEIELILIRWHEDVKTEFDVEREIDQIHEFQADLAECICTYNEQLNTKLDMIVDNSNAFDQAFFNTRLGELNTKIQNESILLHSLINNHDKKITELDTYAVDINGNTSTINNKLNSLDKSIRDEIKLISLAVEEHNTSITNLMEDYKDIHSNASDMSGKLNSLDKSIENIRADLKKDTMYYVALVTDIKNLQEESKLLTDHYNKSLIGLNKQSDGLSGFIKRVEEEYKATAERIDSHTNNIATMRNVMDDLCSTNQDKHKALVDDNKALHVEINRLTMLISDLRTEYSLSAVCDETYSVELQTLKDEFKALQTFVAGFVTAKS